MLVLTCFPAISNEKSLNLMIFPLPIRFDAKTKNHFHTVRLGKFEQKKQKMKSYSNAKNVEWIVCFLVRDSIEKIKYRHFQSVFLSSVVFFLFPRSLQFPFAPSSIQLFIAMTIFYCLPIAVVEFSILNMFHKKEGAEGREKKDKKKEHFQMTTKRLVISCGYDVGITCDRWFVQTFISYCYSNNFAFLFGSPWFTISVEIYSNFPLFFSQQIRIALGFFFCCHNME